MFKLIPVLGLLLVPAVSAAQGIADSADAGPFQDLLENILVFSNDVLIPFILGIGFLVFVWGIFKYFIFGGANEEAKEQGKSLVIYATLGFSLSLSSGELSTYSQPVPGWSTKVCKTSPASTHHNSYPCTSSLVHGFGLSLY